MIKAGDSLEIIERGRVIAVITPVGGGGQPRHRRPSVGGYRSERPLTAEEIDAELARGWCSTD